MYIPRLNQENDLDKLHQLMQRFNFATLFSQHGNEPWATPLPFMLDAQRGAKGTLLAHFARANPHWKAIDPAKDVAVVFQGPHAYISPSWYEADVAVPTWNYAMVQATGKVKLIHDPVALRPFVTDLVTQHEAARPERWDAANAEPVMETLLKAIVGIEIEIEKLEGKYKFSQNKSVTDQQGVIAALSKSEDSFARETAVIMQNNLANI
ncbi:MAG: FMN-binding negative transcriptional regulator [Chloroflexota bacterium]